MITFRDFLAENTVRQLKKSISRIDTSHDPEAEYHEPGEIIDYFANNAALPDKRNAHTNWVVSRYRRGDFQQKHAPRVRTALRNFETHRDKLKEKDLGQYASLADVEQAVKPHVETGTRRGQKDEGAEKIHDENGVRVWHVKSHEAACRYGAGTKWCITSRDDPSHWNYYSERSDVFIMHDSKTGRKRAILPHIPDFRDEADWPVHPATLTHENPELKNVRELQTGPHAFHFAKSAEDKDRLFREAMSDGKSQDIAMSPNLEKRHIDHFFNDKSLLRANLERLASNPALHPEHFDKLIVREDLPDSVRKALRANPALPERLKNHFLKLNNARVHISLAQNPSLKREDVSALLDKHLDGNKEHSRDVVRVLINKAGHKLDSDHIDKILSSGDPLWHLFLSRNENVNLEDHHVEKMLSQNHSQKKEVSKNLVMRSKTQDDGHFEKAWSNLDWSRMEEVLEHGHFDDRHFRRFFHNDDDSDRYLAKNKNLEQDHYKKLWDRHLDREGYGSERVLRNVAFNEEVRPETMTHMVRSLDPSKDAHVKLAKELTSTGASREKLNSRSVELLLDKFQHNDDAHARAIRQNLSMKYDSLSPRSLDILMDHAERPGRKVSPDMLRSKHINTSHLDRLAEIGGGKNELFFEAGRLVDPDKLADRHLDKLHEHGQLFRLAGNPHLKQRHWDRLMKYEDPEVNNELAAKATPDQVDKYIAARHVVGQHRLGLVSGAFDPKWHLDKTLDDHRYVELNTTTLQNAKSLRDDQIHKVIHHENPLYGRALARNESVRLRPEHIDALMDRHERDPDFDHILVTHREQDLLPRHKDRIIARGNKITNDYLRGGDDRT